MRNLKDEYMAKIVPPEISDALGTFQEASSEFESEGQNKQFNSLEDIQKRFAEAPPEFFSKLDPKMMNAVRQILSGNISDDGVKMLIDGVKELRATESNIPDKYRLIAKGVDLNKPLQEHSNEELKKLAEKAAKVISRMKEEDWHRLGIYEPLNHENLTIGDLVKIDTALAGRGISWDHLMRLYNEEPEIRDFLDKKSKESVLNSIDEKKLPRSKLFKQAYRLSKNANEVCFTSKSFYSQLMEFLSKRKYSMAELLFLKALNMEPDSDGEELLNYQSYAAMLCMYCTTNRPSKAYRIYQVMCERGYSPKVDVYNAMISVNLQRKDYERAKYWHDLMLENNVLQDDVTCLLMVKLYSEEGDVEVVNSYLEQMKAFAGAIDSTAYAYLLEMYRKAEKYDTGIQLISQMLEEKVKFNQFAFLSIKRFLKAAKKNYKTAAKNDDPLHRYSSDYKLLCAAMAELDREKFELLWSKIRGQYPRSVQYYNVAIKFYKKLGLLDEALKVYSEIEQTGLNPSRETHILMHEIYQKMDDKRRAQHHFDMISANGDEFCTS